jgi:hypothetical protein
LVLAQLPPNGQETPVKETLLYSILRLTLNWVGALLAVEVARAPILKVGSALQAVVPVITNQTILPSLRHRVIKAGRVSRQEIQPEVVEAQGKTERMPPAERVVARAVTGES